MKKEIKDRKWLGWDDITEKWKYIFTAIFAVPTLGYLIHGAWILKYYLSRGI